MTEVVDGILSSARAIIDFSYKIANYACEVEAKNDDSQQVIDEMELIQDFVHGRILGHEQHLSETMKPLQQHVEGLEGLLEGLHDTLQGSNSNWPFTQSDFDRVLVSIESYKSQIKCVLDEHQIMQQSTNKGLSPRQLEWMEQKRGIVLRWLSPLSFTHRQEDTLATATQRTCKWLFRDSTFKEWLAGTGKSQLVCSGIPGVGKTVLTSIMVDYLKRIFEHQNVAVCYVYCAYDHQEHHSGVNLVGSLLRQLATSQDPIMRAVNNLYIKYQQKDPKARPSLARFSELFVELTKQHFKRVFILVDAMDECHEQCRIEFISELKKLHADLFITTSRIPDILDCFQEASHIEVHTSEKDTARYLLSEIQGNPTLAGLAKADPHLARDIVDHITQKSSGMFLLVTLHMKAIAELDSAQKIRTELNNLPEGIFETYDKAIQLIAAPGPRSKLARKVLHYIIYALRPLSLLALQHALATEADSLDLRQEALVSKENILSACLGLVTYGDQSGNVRLVHYSAQEYFKQSQLFSASTFDPHKELALCCINHLAGLTTVERSSVQSKFPFFLYAAMNWHLHVGRAGTYTEDLNECINNFLEKPSQVLQALRYSGIKPLAIDWNMQDCKPVLVAAVLGLKHTLDIKLKVMNARELQETLNSSKQGALFLAACYGHVGAVRSLLEWAGLFGGERAPCEVGFSDQAFLEQQDSDENRPLSAAVALGHAKVVQLLVQAGANYDARHGIGSYTMLVLAALRGHTECVQFLLEAGADCNLPDFFGMTPLAYGAPNGYTKIVEILLQAGANCDTKNCEHDTPLAGAADEGHIEIVQLLLHAGANCNISNYSGVTPLARAATNGHTEVVHMLLEAGAKFDTCDKNGNTPLARAAQGGHTEVEQLLSQAGAKS